MNPIVVDLNAAILAVTDDEPRVLVVDSSDGSAPALPWGPLAAGNDPTLELALRSWVQSQTGLGLGYVEQLYTFGDRDRIAQPPERGNQGHSLSIAYLALVREEPAISAAAWQRVYDFLPWEDRRRGHPPIVERVIRPGLDRWAKSGGTAERHRQERIEITFGLGEAGWDGDRVLDRYELLWEAGLVAEAVAGKPARREQVGRPMANDHRRILATALGRVRGKIRYRPVVFELLPRSFTLSQLQRVVEALSGIALHKQNFRRLLERGGLVEGTGKLDTRTGGRPAELFSFRREVVNERPKPGVGLPGLRT